jgi:hypothetical protein
MIFFLKEKIKKRIATLLGLFTMSMTTFFFKTKLFEFGEIFLGRERMYKIRKYLKKKSKQKKARKKDPRKNFGHLLVCICFLSNNILF